MKTTKKEKNMTASEFGRLGGQALVKKYGKTYMKKISQKAVKARWKNKKKK